MKLFKTSKTYRHNRFIRAIYGKSITCSLLTQNCIGGVMYNMLGQQFSSPTVNMFIEEDNFVKFAENPGYYLSLDAELFCENYTDPLDNNIHYPVISVADIKLCCLHYKTCSEACEAYNRRRKRFHPDNYVIIANTWNLKDNRDSILKVLKLKNSIVFGNLKGFDEYKNYVFLKAQEYHYDHRMIVRPDLTSRYKSTGKKVFEVEYPKIWKWLAKVSRQK